MRIFTVASVPLTQKPHLQIIMTISQRFEGYVLDAIAMCVQSVNKSLELHEGEGP